MSSKYPASRFMDSPWSQALTGGALALVPGSKYPAWLRRTMTWGSAATVAAIIAVPGVGSATLKRASGQKTVETVTLSPAARAGCAVGGAAFTYGLWRFGWWVDTASEAALRRMRVPYPRLVIGVVVGTLYYVNDDRKQPPSDPRVFPDGTPAL